MIIEENNRKITGATADAGMNDSAQMWSQDFNLLNYESCPEEFKTLIENYNLEDIVYWKLKSTLEKQSPSKQNEILKGVLIDVERPLFSIILKKTNGNQSKAANLLGCNRNTLHRKLKDFSINPKEMKKSNRFKSAGNELNQNSKLELFNENKPLSEFAEN